MKYLILGNGYIGNKLCNYFKDVASTAITGSRIFSKTDVLDLIDFYKPEIIINAIGKTGSPNIDWCENHKEVTLESNVLVPICIALACKEKGIMMVHIGSGCIYNGTSDISFTEEDVPNFYGSYYSRTKILAESALKELDNILQIRIRMPIDSDDSPKNLINKLLKYHKIISIPNSITVVPDFLKATKELLDKKVTGIFNVVNKGYSTHAVILETYLNIRHKKKAYEVINLEELDQLTIAKRSNCVLSIGKLEKYVEMPYIIASLNNLWK